MTYYIENIFICLAIPLILSLLFRGGKDRKFTFLSLLEWECACYLHMSAVFWQDITEQIQRQRSGRSHRYVRK